MWLSFLLILILEFSTVKTDYLTKVLVPIFLFFLFLKLQQKNQFKSEKELLKLHRIFTKTTVFIIIFLFFGATLSYYIFDYLALNGTLWDLTMYIQETYSMATTNQPIATFPGEIVNHFFTHRSISIWILGFLYRIFQSPYVVLSWQGFFLMAPGLLSMSWYLAVMKKNKKRPSPFGALLCFLGWAFMPAVLRMQSWPYTFYMMGFTILGFAYLFYYLEKTTLLLLCLALLPFEKEDFGVISIAFGGLLAFEGFRFFKKSKPDFLKIFGGVAVSFIGIYSFWSFHKTSAKVVTFESRFGNLGNTPSEAILHILTSPMHVFKEFLRPEVLNYLYFFVGASFLWLLPNLKWKHLKYAIPVLPILIANCLASYEPMHQLKDPYAFPITVGLVAILVLGIFNTLLQKKGEVYAHLALMGIVVFPLLWGHQSPFRTLKEKVLLASERESFRILLEPIRNDLSILVCCEDRLCSYLAARPFLLETRFCLDPLKSEKLFHQMREKGAKKIMLIQYSNNSTFLKVSNL